MTVLLVYKLIFTYNIRRAHRHDENEMCEMFYKLFAIVAWRAHWLECEPLCLLVAAVAVVIVVAASAAIAA